MPKNNKRMTRQRFMVLQAVMESDLHPSADEIYESVRNRLPRISLGTVYRNLDILAEQGKIQMLQLGGMLKRFDRNTSKHYHIKCIRCGCVHDVPILPQKMLEEEARQTTRYMVLDHCLEFSGICPACLEKENEDKSYVAVD